MGKEFMRCTSEQVELLGEYQDSIVFLLQYISVYEQQIMCSTKVFLNQIPYYPKFQLEFLDRILRIAVTSDLDKHGIEGIENMVLAFGKRPFYDRDIYEYSKSCILKAANIMIDRAQMQVLEQTFSGVEILYRYTTLPIDLRRALALGFCDALMQEDSIDPLVPYTDLVARVNNINQRIRGVAPSELLFGENEVSHVLLHQLMLSKEKIPLYDSHSIDQRCEDNSDDQRSRGEISTCGRILSYNVEDIIKEIPIALHHWEVEAKPFKRFHRIMQLCTLLSLIEPCAPYTEKIQTYAKSIIV